MIPKEIFQKVRRIEITTRRLVTDVFAGQYHSVFKGRGMEFDEVREYQIGDEIRDIDHNVTARTGRLHVKKYVEERELTVMILVDLSASCRFGSVRQLKSSLAAELAAVLAFSAIRNNDKVGLVLFTDRIEKFIPPRKGVRHVLRVIREILYFQPTGKGTNLKEAIEFLNKVTVGHAIAFIISDFFEPRKDKIFSLDDMAYSFKQALVIANKRHDVIAISLTDPLEIKMPDVGIVSWEDAETHEQVFIDTSDAKWRQDYERNAAAWYRARRMFFASIGVDYLDVRTDSSYDKTLISFFMRRRKRV